MTHDTKPRLRLALALLAAAWATGEATAGTDYAVRNGTVAGGGQISQAGPFKLISTLGEAAMGTTSNGQFRLTSGYPATIGNVVQGGPGGGRIFADGFED
jgi:hypothetical protein